MKKPAIQQAKPNQQVITHTQNWAGPLPPPEALARFDEIIPNGAERILRMTEQEQAHRLDLEQRALVANITNSQESAKHVKYGLIAGAAVSALSLIGAVVSAWLGAEAIVSIALVSVPVLGMVKALTGGKAKP